MSLAPRHRVARYAAAAWALACAVSLAAFLLFPAAPGARTALTTLVPLYLAGTPSSHAAMVAVIELRLRIYLDGGALGVSAEGLILWSLLAVLGYLQWFVLLPWLVRLTQRLLARWISPSR
jgi:hypothetical protein